MQMYEVWIHYKDNNGLIRCFTVAAAGEPEALQLALDKLELCEGEVAANYIYNLTEVE